MKEIIASVILKELKNSLKKEEIERLIEIPPSQEMGDFAFPCFILAKELKKNPVQIAQELAGKIKSNEFERIEAKGPYLNFFVNRKSVAEDTLKEIQKQKDKYGSQKIKEQVIIEFPSPNTNKPLHIGHARNLVFGQAITNLLSFLGNSVKIVNLNNDRGVHICKSMIAYEKFGKGDSPAHSKRKSDHFVGDYYVKFAKEAQTHPSLEQEAQECLVNWENKDKKTLVLWKKMNFWALSGFKETYKKFGYKPNKDYFESKIYNQGKEIILDALNKGIFSKKDDGAIYADLSAKGLGEKILLRADGTSIYITQDAYLAFLKQKEFPFDKSIYITATEQNHHFQVLFEILKMLKYPHADKLCHLSYGMVNLESGRMKSREGNVVDSDDLIEDMKKISLDELTKRYPDLSKKEKEARAKEIVMAALRYYFLKVDAARDMTFKPEESLSFEGNTGPYLLYSYARARSILKKAKYNQKSKYSAPKTSEHEKALIMELGKFPEIVQNAYNNLAPNLIANYAYELSQAFNEFYHSEQVIGSENEQFRLVLVDSFSQVLKNALSLLGINTIEKM